MGILIDDFGGFGAEPHREYRCDLERVKAGNAIDLPRLVLTIYDYAGRDERRVELEFNRGERDLIRRCFNSDTLR